MKFFPWVILLSLGLVSCSGSKSAQKVSEETPQIELSDADEFIENGAEAGAETPSAEAIVTEETPQETTEVMEEPLVSETEIVDQVNDPAMDETPVESMAPAVVADAGMQQDYTVLKNETLMIIAFKLFGDYEKWKELASSNRDVLKGNTALREGMVLKYHAPAEPFVWNPEGLPYLIRTGDTLSGISKNVYATDKKWKMIWDNNRPLIKNPNKIYSGFTIYYLENGREVAAEI